MVKKSKQTILIIYNDLGIGGIQRKIADTVDWISKAKEFNNTRLYLILDHKKSYDLEEDIFFNRVKQSKVEIFCRPQENIWRIKFPLGVYVFWKTLNLRPTIILAFMEKYSFIAIAIKSIYFWRKIRIVVSYDNIASLLIPIEQKNKIRKFLRITLIHLLFPKANRIILPSNEARIDMCKNFGVPNEKLSVNRNWVLDFSEKRGNNYKYDLIYTGRVDSVKNLSSFVEIVAIVKKSYPKVKACIVGWGEEIDKISNLIREKSLQSSIELAGSQENISSYLSKSKIFLLTSFFEGLPISALEAMAFSLPIIALEYPGVRELVTEGGNGYICIDTKDASDRVLTLLVNEPKRIAIGNRAREYVKRAHNKQSLKSFVASIGG